MRKKFYKKILTYTLLILLISMATASSIDASVIKKSKHEELETHQDSIKRGIIIKDKDDAKNYVNTERSVCLGSIYGHTGEGYIWGFSPVRFVKVQAGCRTTISGPLMGGYRIQGLPLGTYTVTGSKIGYETYTTTVTLTERYPDKQVFIDLTPNDESVNILQTSGKNSLFSSTLISTNTWTDLFSTTAFFH
jgi:hypothetical protein